MRLARYVLPALGLGWAAWGCNAILGIEDRPLRPDAADGAADAPTGDGADEAGGTDGGGDGASACPPDAVFCDDFEAPTIDSTWLPLVDDGGVVALSKPGHDSAQGLSATMVNPGGSQLSATLAYDGSNATDVEVLVDVNLVTLTEGGSIAVLRLSSASDSWVSLAVNLTGTKVGATLNEYTPDAGFTPTDTAAPRAAVWTRLDVHLHQATGQIEVSWDGHAPSTAPTHIDPRGGFRVEIGAGEAYGGTQSALFDDLVVLAH